MTIVLDATSGMTLPGAATSIQAGSLTSMSAISASGVNLDFTSIPNWVKRISVMFQNVSTSGTSLVQIQLGSVSIATTGYKSTASFGAGSAAQYAFATTGFITDTSAVVSAITRSGCYVFTLFGSNTWVGSGNLGGDSPSGLVTFACAGVSPVLGGALDRIRVTTINGTDTFDLGSVNVMYE